MNCFREKKHNAQYLLSGRTAAWFLYTAQTLFIHNRALPDVHLKKNYRGAKQIIRRSIYLR